MASTYGRPHLIRTISTTSTRFSGAGWLEKIKGVLTGKTSTSTNEAVAETPSKLPTKESFSLIDFANQMDKVRKLQSLNKYVGRGNESIASDSFEKQAGILRYLGAIDPSGKNLLNSQKQDAANQCKCTLADIESALSKYTWAKDAQMKIEKLKEEGKPMPKTFSEVKKLMGSTPLDGARINQQKSARISKNALCPCGSNKKYKRCCGTAENW